MFDSIVVGSGPGAVMCAYGLRGERVLVLDAGRRPAVEPGLDGNLYELRQSRDDLFEPLIGRGFESLRNIRGAPVNLKLKAPAMRFIAEDGETPAPVVSDSFDAVISLAEGGLANAWGAGVYRFTENDLAGFPIGSADLAPHYDTVGRLIGVSGAMDDLVPFFGAEPDLLPPLKLSAFYQQFFREYQKRRSALNAEGIFVGRPRLAVLTEPRGGRTPYRYENLEFFRPHDPAVYNPAYTLRDLVRAGEVAYESGYLVESFRETAEGVEVTALGLATGTRQAFTSGRLFLGAGALNSARIVLRSHGDFHTRLPLLDNPIGCIPIFRLGRVGAPLEVHDSSLAQLNIVYEDRAAGHTLQATLYGVTGPLRSDVLFQFPLNVSASLVWAKHVAPAMGLAMLFHPDRVSGNNSLRLAPDGSLRLDHETPETGAPERRLIRAFRKMGYLSAPALCQYPRSGNGLHYAGTLPMRARPGRYETGPDGRLAGTRAVYVVDGGSLTALPAKNLTYTIMANALRIATLARAAQ